MNRSKSVRLVMMLLLAVGGLTRSVAAVRTIADVPSADTLEQTVPLRLASGWTIHLGLLQAERDQPWRLLYCLAAFEGKGPAPPIRHDLLKGQALGPVQVDVTWAERPKPVADKVSSAERVVSPPLLFSAPIPLAWKGTCTIRLWGPDGALLARRAVAVERAPKWYWQDFARIRRSGPDQKQDSVVRDQVYAAAPCPFAVTATRNNPPDNPSLTLSRDHGIFHIRSDQPITDWPDYYLLARWWVNGTPIEPPRSERPRMISLGRAVALTREVQVAFGLPDDLGAIKAGDRIALQVMYAPGGYDWITTQPSQQKNHAASRSAIATPLLSNCLEWVVTADQLREADHPQAGK